MKEFPTCRTCKHADIDENDISPQCTRITNEGFYLLLDEPNPKIDRFFCSEHETKDGERFVTWGKI